MNIWCQEEWKTAFQIAWCWYVAAHVAQQNDVRLEKVGLLVAFIVSVETRYPDRPVTTHTF